MRNGQCPKCGSWEVYSGANVPQKQGSFNSNTIPVGGNIWFGFSRAELDNYVCVNCGYVESYISDSRKLQEIAKTWPRVTADADTRPESSPR
jgi:predicted nucleic-acid-binding Zn-ribbon protein